jgi:hypothetical protein
LKHRASPDFWTCYTALPPEIQKLANQAYEHLKQDPQYPSVRLKKVGRFWSARVGGNYRALAVEAEGTLVWFWIGRHAEYDKLLH